MSNFPDHEYEIEVSIVSKKDGVDAHADFHVEFDNKPDLNALLEEIKAELTEYFP